MFRTLMKKYFRLLYNYLKPQFFFVLLLIITIICSVAIQLVNPQVVRYIIDSAVEKQSMNNIVQAALLFSVLSFCNQLFIILSTYVGQSIGWTAINNLKTNMIAHCLRLDLTYHKQHHEAEMIERIDGDTAALLNFFSNLILFIFKNLILSVGILTLLFREDWRIGIGLLVFTVMAIFVFARTQSIAASYWGAVREKSAKFFGFIGEQLAGREDIRSSGSVSNVMHKFYQHIKEWLPLTYKAKMMNYKMWSFQIGVFAVGNIIAFGLGGYLWRKGIVSIGTDNLVVNYTELLSKPIGELREQFTDLQKAGASITRIEEIFATKSKLDDCGKVGLSDGALEVDVKNLYFSYDENDMILENISFKLNKGKKLAVLGRTGSGKTTLARLIARLYDPNSGEVFIDGKPLREVPLHYLRSHIAYVTQEVQIFHASLRDNLTFFNKDISEETILAAIEEIGLGEWFKSLPKGLDTILEAGGVGLSAGEMQLLVFVRTFLKKPGLIILDEVSSRLDPSTEELFNVVLRKLLEGRSAIIIAHRLQSIRFVDDIIILENGVIKEYGEYEILKCDTESNFYELLQGGIEEVLK